ncbi:MULTISPECIES: PAS domain S-box protein [Ramlibacter]|uniref:histidine kinase n=1 Tax=Ramlibacter aquaticus TaxID=2780094 RepID=A0ABR9SA17_9BURK|nr:MULTISPECIES: PAS domain S-box protein [Ramlibacter]MBE7939192.1 PAS domain S-box protein [Ramlibacter aquaticus]
MQSRLKQSRRGRERFLALLTGILLAAVIGVTVLDTWRDHDAVLQDSDTRSAAELQALESAWSATLRDAANATISAALLLEDPQLLPAHSDEAVLHEQLRRELWDATGAARLLYTDGVGGVLASSADFPVRRRGLRAGTQVGIAVAHLGERELLLGFAEPSAVDGEFVLPLWCEVRGAVPGYVRAELRLPQLAQALGPASSVYRGTTVILDPATGRALLRLPANPRVRELVLARTGPTGSAEVRSAVDGVLRVFSWRVMAGSGLIIARGLDKSALLAPVWTRARSRALVALVLAGGLVLLVVLLARYLRRLDGAMLDAARFERRYATAMEASSIGIVLMDVQGRWLHANPAMCTLLGYSLQELLAMPSELHTPEPVRANRRALLQQLASGTLERIEETRQILRKDGSEAWLHIRASLMREAPDAPPLILSHVEDVTQQRADREALQALNQDLEHRVQQRTRELSIANADLEAFSYSAAHDLRSPLGRLVSYADLLSSELAHAPERTRRWVEAVRRQAQDMNAIIESLLALARISRAELHPVRIGLHEKFTRMVAEWGHGPQAGQEVTWRIGSLPEARGDRALLRTAIANLLDNALKYSSQVAQPVIEIGAFEPAEPGMVGCYVRDNGAGFDMAHAAGLFKPFKRMHTVSEFPGSGIGLAIVHRAITRLGGRVWAEAAVDRGATFFFTLPAA